MVVLKDSTEEVRAETVDGGIDWFSDKLALAVHQSASVAYLILIVLVACYARLGRTTCFLVGVTDIVVDIIDIVYHTIEYNTSVVANLLIKLALYPHHGISGCELDIIVLRLNNPIAQSVNHTQALVSICHHAPPLVEDETAQ